MKYTMAIDCESTKLPCRAVTEQGAKREATKQYADNYRGETRSIVDVRADELVGYTQCHWFGGIGIWSYALRQAGWPDDRPVWTGSCPCQPFSAAGSGKGFSDDRHLWPVFNRLIQECRPATVFGEQVSGKAGMQWLDNVQADLEAGAYAVGAVTFPACSVGAPMLRQRLFWMADAGGARSEAAVLQHKHGRQADSIWKTSKLGVLGVSSNLADATKPRLQKPDQGRESEGEAISDPNAYGDASEQGPQGRLRGWEDSQREVEHGRTGCDSATSRPGPTNGFWADADWLGCRDGKWRPVKRSLKPLVNEPATGVVHSRDPSRQEVEGTKEARAMRLRGYGNAIVAEQATIFIQSATGALT